MPSPLKRSPGLWSHEDIADMTREEIAGAFLKIVRGIEIAAGAKDWSEKDQAFFERTGLLAQRAAASVAAEAWTLEQAREGLTLFTESITKGATLWAALRVGSSLPAAEA